MRPRGRQPASPRCARRVRRASRCCRSLGEDCPGLGHVVLRVDPLSGPIAGRWDPTRICKALEARLPVACISNAEAGAVACISNAACENPPPGCYLVVECPERWKASRRWARIFMRWHTASSCRVLSASIYARGCTDCMGACASYRRPTPSRAQGTVDPVGWKPRLPVRAKLKRSEPEAGGASLCLE